MRNKLSVPSIDTPGLRWRPLAQHFPRPESRWRNWLLDPGSLTSRLVALSNGNFSVQVVSEGWLLAGSPYLIKTLGPGFAGQRMWSRKVVLSGANQPWVTAHTLVPQSSLDGGLGQVRKLNNKPLGAFLFSHPGLQRSRLDITPTSEAWGRCSQFRLFECPILVAEFFLPELIAAG